MDHSTLHLQGHLPAEQLPDNAVIDGERGQVRIRERIVRERPDSTSLVTLLAEDGQRLTYEAGFPVAYYATTGASA